MPPLKPLLGLFIDTAPLHLPAPLSGRTRVFAFVFLVDISRTQPAIAGCPSVNCISQPAASSRQSVALLSRLLLFGSMVFSAYCEDVSRTCLLSVTRARARNRITSRRQRLSLIRLFMASCKLCRNLSVLPEDGIPEVIWLNKGRLLVYALCG